jgi:hypothetical protein
MFESVSWSQYIIALLICTIVYYLYIWVVYYKAMLPSLRGGQNAETLLSSDEEQVDENTASVQDIMDELRPLFTYGYHKNELILALQKQLKPHRLRNGKGFRSTINAFIANESLTTCSIRLGEEDQRAVWM